MDESVNEVAELTQDQQLQLRIKNGEVSKEEVDKVWEETRWLSAQTPFEMRKIILEIGELKPAEQVQLQAILDLRAALFNSNSKFAHLVAGTEEIVEKLSKINQLESLVESLSNKLDHMNVLFEGFLEERRKERGFDTDALKDEPGDVELPIRMGEEAQEPVVEEVVNRRIGSMWDPHNPRKA